MPITRPEIKPISLDFFNPIKQPTNILTPFITWFICEIALSGIEINLIIKAKINIPIKDIQRAINEPFKVFRKNEPSPECSFTLFFFFFIYASNVQYERSVLYILY